MKALLITSLLSFFAISVQAQVFETPTDVTYEKAEDYVQYEDEVVDCFNWMMATPHGEQQKKRDEANRFLVTWILGSPSVSVEISEKIVTFMQSSPDMLVIFLGGWANYTLTNDYSKDKKKGIKAALNAVIEYYENNREKLKKDKNIEEYIKMKAGDGKKFEEYIQDNA